MTLKGRPKGSGSYARLARLKKHLDKAAEEAGKAMVKTIQKQSEQGKADAAIWVLEHYQTADGERPVGPGVDKQIEKGNQSPTVLIGVQLGNQAQLPSVESIDTIEAPALPSPLIQPVSLTPLPDRSPARGLAGTIDRTTKDGSDK